MTPLAFSGTPKPPEEEAKADAQFVAAPECGANLTGEFNARYQHPDRTITSNQTAALKPYRVLIVHGLLGDVGLSFAGFLDKFDKRQGLIGYLKDQKTAVRELGLECSVAAFKSASVDRSGTKIAEAIEASDRPVIVLSHSKGGLDTLDALLKLQKVGKLSKVAGWISIQGALYGSPDADVCDDSKFKSAMARVAITCLGGHYQAIKDLTIEHCEAYQAEHREEIDRVVKAVPTICFVSWKKTPDEAATQRDPDLLNDGAVPAHRGVLPGADYVAKANIGHAQTVIHVDADFDRVAFTQALLGMLGEKILSGR